MKVTGSIFNLFKRKTEAYWRNTLGLKINLNYWAYKKYAQFKFKNTFSEKDKVLACTLKEDGIAILGVSDVTEMVDIATEIFNKLPVVNGYAQFPRKYNSLLAPHIYKILTDHSGPIYAHYGANFRVNWFECQKVSSEGKQPEGSSFAYHTDDTPAHLFKVFIYLTDTFEENAAFRAFSYKVTDELIKKGILTSSAPGTPRSSVQHLVTPELEKQLKVVEGKKGTVFIFDNNLIHKGTMARKGFRIHISMEILPSHKPLNFENFAKDCNEDIGEYYPKNPFSLLARDKN